MTHDETVTRRIIASILGILGAMLLVDVAVVASVNPEANFDGFRQMLFVIVGGLLVVGGAVTFAWPKRGTVETMFDEQSIDHPGKSGVDTQEEAPHPTE